MDNEESLRYAKEHNIYVNEAIRVLSGEISLEKAKSISREFDDLVESGVVKPVSEDDVAAALEECQNCK